LFLLSRDQTREISHWAICWEYKIESVLHGREIISAEIVVHDRWDQATFLSFLIIHKLYRHLSFTLTVEARVLPHEFFLLKVPIYRITSFVKTFKFFISLITGSIISWCRSSILINSWKLSGNRSLIYSPIEALWISDFELSVHKTGNFIKRTGRSNAEERSNVLSIDLEAILQIHDLSCQSAIETLLWGQNLLSINLIKTKVFI
jgi:hypothetical protein